MSGYVFKFQGSSFAPDGKVEAMTDAEITAHNKRIADEEVKAMMETGKAVLYSRRSKPCPDGFKRDFVGTWDGSHNWQVMNQNTSRHNMAGTRLDVWFVGPDGRNWHGVNIGDNDIVRCQRLKS